MKGIPRGKYTKEFRQEAVKLVIEEKLSWGKARRRLNLATSPMYPRMKDGCTWPGTRTYSTERSWAMLWGRG